MVKKPIILLYYKEKPHLSEMWQLIFSVFITRVPNEHDELGI